MELKAEPSLHIEAASSLIGERIYSIKMSGYVARLDIGNGMMAQVSVGGGLDSSACFLAPKSITTMPVYVNEVSLNPCKLLNFTKQRDWMVELWNLRLGTIAIPIVIEHDGFDYFGVRIHIVGFDFSTGALIFSA